MQENDNANAKELFRNQMILMKDNIDDVYDIQVYDVNAIEMRMDP